MTRTTPEERSAHIDLWRSSGLSRAAYCREAGLDYGSFTRWARAVDAGRDGEATDGEASSAFIEVSTVEGRSSPPSCASVVRVTCDDGVVRVETAVDRSPAWIAELVARLRSC